MDPALEFARLRKDVVQMRLDDWRDSVPSVRQRKVEGYGACYPRPAFSLDADRLSESSGTR